MGLIYNRFRCNYPRTHHYTTFNLLKDVLKVCHDFPSINVGPTVFKGGMCTFKLVTIAFKIKK